MFICCFCCYYNRQLAWSGSDYNFLFVLLDCQSLFGATQICPVCVPHSGHSRTCAVIYSSSSILKAFGMLVRSDSYSCNSEVHTQLYGITFLRSFLSAFSSIKTWLNSYLKCQAGLVAARFFVNFPFS